MKITKKQSEEIDFLSKRFHHFIPTEAEKEEYLKWTVFGVKGKDENRLFQAKRGLDMTIKIWREDLRRGNLFIEELYKDKELICLYFTKILNEVKNNL